MRTGTMEISNTSRQGGFTLLEVLITVLILSIGLLGLAGLQLSALKLNDSAERRSQATILAYDILDRMRANRTAAEAGAYDIDTGATAPSSATCVGTGSSCDAAGMRNSDLFEWHEALKDRLPSGSGVIATSGATPPVITITVRWNEQKADQAAKADRTTPTTTTMKSMQIRAIL